MPYADHVTSFDGYNELERSCHRTLAEALTGRPMNSIFLLKMMLPADSPVAMQPKHLMVFFLRDYIAALNRLGLGSVHASCLRQQVHAGAWYSDYVFYLAAPYHEPYLVQVAVDWWRSAGVGGLLINDADAISLRRFADDHDELIYFCQLTRLTLELPRYLRTATSLTSTPSSSICQQLLEPVH